MKNLMLVVGCVMLAAMAWAAPSEKTEQETLDWFLDNVYGRPPVGRPADMAFEGNAILFGGGKVKVNLTVALPEGASREKPCPVVLMGDFRTWNNDDH